jgi:hypothetical protein
MSVPWRIYSSVRILLLYLHLRAIHATQIVALAGMLVACSACGPRTVRDDPSGWTGVATLSQVEELRSVEALLPLHPDSIVALYQRYDPQTFYHAFGSRVNALGLLIDTLNSPLRPSLRIDTLSIDHTFESIGEAALRGKTLFISSSYFYMYESPEVCRSVVTHEFGHIYYRLLDPGSHSELDILWERIQRSALFYIFRDGEYAGNARFGGHPEESPAELFASTFNLLRNRPQELSSRMLFVSIPDRQLVDRVIAILGRIPLH